MLELSYSAEELVQTGEQKKPSKISNCNVYIILGHFTEVKPKFTSGRSTLKNGWSHYISEVRQGTRSEAQTDKDTYGRGLALPWYFICGIFTRSESTESWDHHGQLSGKDQENT